MKNNQLIDVAVILICILATVAVGHYYIAKKERESLQNVEEPVESKTQKMIPPVVDWSKFEVSVKRTE